MQTKRETFAILLVFLIFILLFPCMNTGNPVAGQTLGSVNVLKSPTQEIKKFPLPLENYNDSKEKEIISILKSRIKKEPFNLVALIIFFVAILHTFMASRFIATAKKWEKAYEEKQKAGLKDRNSVHMGAALFHFLGEVEAVFGIWAIALAAAIVTFYDWQTFVLYIGHSVDYTEVMFVVVIMTLASTRPILKLSELIMWKVSGIFGGMLGSWWLTILTVGPLLGSFITEPAAMTISAYLLADKFFALNPSSKFKYATLGLLFINVSIGGTLTSFAAPPILMVAEKWSWDSIFMITHFGWKAILGILTINIATYFLFKKELSELQDVYVKIRRKRQIQRTIIDNKLLELRLEAAEMEVNEELGFIQRLEEKFWQMKSELVREGLDQFSISDPDEQINVEGAIESRFDDVKKKEIKMTIPGLIPKDKRPVLRDPEWDNREDWVPKWIMFVHVLFMAWTVVNAHHPALFIGGFLFFLGFARISTFYQNRIDLKPPLLVGFFLAGLVIHGGVQAWWIAPIIANLGGIPLMLGATFLTSFNDNAAITYLSTLVQGLSPQLKYSVVAGSIAGGGLTIIANAPNPAGQSILKNYFKNGISAPRLLLATIVPTLVIWLIFLIL